MKFLVAIFALVALASADVSHLKTLSSEANAEVLESESDVAPDRFNYHYKTSNGIFGEESGQLKNAGREDAAIEVQGSHQYTAPDGTPIQLSYIANELGYQPQGAHLPTTPAPLPIPEYIIRALKYIESHPPQPEHGQRF